MNMSFTQLEKIRKKIAEAEQDITEGRTKPFDQTVVERIKNRLRAEHGKTKQSK